LPGGRTAPAGRSKASAQATVVRPGIIEGGVVVEDIEQKVMDIVSEQMGVERSQITAQSSFVNDLGADSLDTVELVMEFEDAFNIQVPDEDAEKIQTVGEAITYIKERV